MSATSGTPPNTPDAQRIAQLRSVISLTPSNGKFDFASELNRIAREEFEKGPSTRCPDSPYPATRPTRVRAREPPVQPGGCKDCGKRGGERPINPQEFEAPVSPGQASCVSPGLACS